MDFKRLKQNNTAAWAERDVWQPIYDECYAYCVPQRNVYGSSNAHKKREIFDATAIKALSKFAAQFQQDFFPPGEPFFKLTLGPIARQALGQEAAAYDASLEEISDVMQPFFLKGGFDNCVNEMGVDLAIGMAVMLIVEQQSEDDPIQFLNIPIDQCAVTLNNAGDTKAVYWKTTFTKNQIKENYPEGSFPADFMKANGEDGNEKVTLHQDFYQEGKQWRLCAYVEKSEKPIAEQKFDEQPIIAVPFSRIPGENMGRGPLLNALPDIKTLNTAKEMMLKASALSMLGVFIYKAGGAFNPNTAPLSPGKFWPVQYTGGVMGADVQKLDLGGGNNMQVGQLLTSELKQSVSDFLYEDNLPERGKTPLSASEVVYRKTNGKEIRFNTLTRFVRPLNTFIVQRVMGVLYRKKLIDNKLNIDLLMLGIEILSPLAQTLKLTRWKSVLDYLQVLSASGVPPQSQVDVNGIYSEMARDFDVPTRFIITDEQRKQQEQQAQQQAAMQQMAEFVTQNPEALGGMMGGGGQPQAQGQPQPQPQQTVM
jgi:hypothetical protein